MRTQPGTQQRPEALNSVDVDFAKTVAILITGILTTGVTHRLVAIAPSGQAGVDVILIGVNERARGDSLADDRLDRCLLHIRQHVQNDLSAALDQAEDWRLVLFQRASAWRALKPATLSRAPLFTTSAGWPLCPATT